MKRTLLISKIEAKGCKLVRHGANHDIYSNGKRKIIVPRHNDINENLAKKIIKDAGG